MRESKVRDLVLPLDRYPVVSGDATLGDVFLALEGALRGGGDRDPAAIRDFDVLVLDAERRVVGRLTVWDVLQGLEPQSRRRVDSLAMVEGYDAWDRPLAHLAAKVDTVRARDLVRALHDDEYIEVDAGLDQALRRLVDHRYLSLIATDGRETVGLLRVVDVFRHVCEQLRARLD